MEDLGFNSLFHGFSESRQYLNSSHAKMPIDIQNLLYTPARRKSRKHQRCLKYKAFLERNSVLDTKDSEKHKNLKQKDKCSTTYTSNHCSCLQSCEGNNHCDVNNQSAKLEEIKALLVTLPVTSHCSSGPANDYDSGLSMPSSSASSRPSSPVTWLKPGKCVAIDCEMVGTGPAGRISALARCSVVNYRGDVVYDKYIKPELPITNYRTKWSGITKRHMKNAIPFKVAQKEVLKILKDKRVVGHALHNDFKALKYFHPSEQTRDTSMMPLLNQKAGLPLRPSASLKNLALHLLHKNIQLKMFVIS
ncbi:apoptosis-enhancing nuclease isoform X2 [Bombina bombina]|uniref:apoptosis-enhancing nuclease isoform X2 n=1 Tax=Bombina bombina TaxID=8345 RepID=UPI00235B2EBF|nr:apoptosis-enhancing nuclease isoform X2 [Bombina bombina]